MLYPLCIFLFSGLITLIFISFLPHFNLKRLLYFCIPLIAVFPFPVLIIKTASLPLCDHKICYVPYHYVLFPHFSQIQLVFYNIFPTPQLLRSKFFRAFIETPKSQAMLKWLLYLFLDYYGFSFHHVIFIPEFFFFLPLC